MAAESESIGSVEDIPPLWRPRRAVRLVLQGMHWAILAILMLAAARWATSRLSMVEGLAVAATSLVVAFSVHEAGKYFVARRSGMIIMLVRFGWLEIRPVRDGWQTRWKPPSSLGRFSYVYAVPDPALPLRGPCMAFAVGGALATLALVGLAAACMATATHAHERTLLTLALCASIAPLVYLFPSRASSVGDAIEAWRWWRHPPNERYLRPMRMHARMVWGTPASSFSADEVSLLGASVPMNQLWYAMKVAQQRGEWSEVVRFQEAWTAAIPRNINMREYLSELTAVIATELRWMDAVHHRDATRLPSDSDIRASTWANVGIGPRCRATRAWLVGDPAALAQAIDDTLSVAGRNPDRSLLESERLILGALTSTRARQTTPAAP
jgi:hypothetical protein